ncbi:39S ribosomal protein L12, mitochondrial [Patella vulgata]|uniref:39S ribosomal protein L12, mitochondrial n=1 Tax=Patella vulgata TaxID=6465 RepID=UPI00217F973A|nr:39S ribosomal protein L12, mitochondrial [Patella vulgata]
MQASKRLITQTMHMNVSSYCRRIAARLQTTAVKHLYQSRAYSAETISAPNVEGMEKHYQPKIVKLVEDIGQLNLLEVADLNELLKKTLNIQDAPMMAMGMAAAAPKEDEEDIMPVKEKVIFSVKLTKYEDSKKIQLIKAVKGLIPDLNLVQAKKFVESIPQVVKADLPKDEAEQLKAALEAAGGVAEIE